MEKYDEVSDAIEPMNSDEYTDDGSETCIDEEAHFCDFCGTLLQGRYELLEDGRERCIECSKSVITKNKDFERLFRKTRRLMRKIFGINFGGRVCLKALSANEMAEKLGEKFIPTRGYDARNLGLTLYSHRCSKIFIENGIPASAAEVTMVYHLTHVWSFHHQSELDQFESADAIYAVIADWAVIQYCTSIGQEEYANNYMESCCRRNKYLKKYLDFYPIKNKRRVRSGTPFNNKRNDDSVRVIL